jgi:CrcB protein
MQKILLVMAGGAFGTLARYGISGFAYKISSSIFPWGTLTVNVLGSFLIGLLWGIFESRNLSNDTRTFVFIGILGGFTTFSSFAFETLTLFKAGDTKMALMNILLNNILALAFVFAGYFLVRLLINYLK